MCEECDDKSDATLTKLENRYLIKNAYLQNLSELIVLIICKKLYMKKTIGIIEAVCSATEAKLDKGVNEITRKLKDSINTMKSYSYKQMHDLEQKPKIPNNSLDYWKVLVYEVDVLKQGLSVRDEQLWLLMDIIKKMLGEMGDMRVKMKYLKESMDTIVTHN
ncbi:uncharacterized protein LOC109601877 isoform X2 [Aethina tumida]|uniref:uncharacterized protein LOC109601877 isoform X2 n=1 Tax=Aethina tumida TaxID=116153 RepID=UPI0021487A5A|nr:uncharacterized protein LOC109601877 isoform X2 [Aethina tumida]